MQCGKRKISVPILSSHRLYEIDLMSPFFFICWRTLGYTGSFETTTLAWPIAKLIPHRPFPMGPAPITTLLAELTRPIVTSFVVVPPTVKVSTKRSPSYSLLSPYTIWKGLTFSRKANEEDKEESTIDAMVSQFIPWSCDQFDRAGSGFRPMGFCTPRGTWMSFTGGICHSTATYTNPLGRIHFACTESNPLMEPTDHCSRYRAEPTWAVGAYRR